MFARIAEDLAEIESPQDGRAEIEKQIERAVLHLQLPSSWPLKIDDGTTLQQPAGFILVRHGATDWSVTGQHTGRTDLPLSKNGCCEAIIVRSILKGKILMNSIVERVVYCSPLSRARRTCELALGPEDPDASKPNLTPLLLEVDYGEFEGKTSSEINTMLKLKEHEFWDVFDDGCPKGESVGDISKRADEFIDMCRTKCANKLVVAFTHGHMSRAIATRLFGLKIENATLFQNDTASISLIRWRRDRYVLDSWNIRPPKIRFPTQQQK